MVGRAPIFARCVWVAGETGDMSSSRGGAQFRGEREGEREGKREGEGGSQSIELLDAGFYVCFTCYEFRTSNSFSFFSYNLSLYRIGSQSKISNRSFYPIGLDKLAKLKDRQS